MKIKFYLTFKSALKKAYKELGIMYNLFLIIFIGILIAGLFLLDGFGDNSEIYVVAILALASPVIFAIPRLISPELTFTEDKLITFFSIYQGIKVIEYSKINYINMDKAPKEISINYQIAANTARTVTLYPENYGVPLEEILACFPPEVRDKIS